MKTAELLVPCQWHQNFNKIARDQVTHYMEIQELLPDNQYVFVQKDPQWLLLFQQCSKSEFRTQRIGWKLWDSCAVPLCPSLICKELKMYRFDKNACKWLVPPLTGHCQRKNRYINLRINKIRIRYTQNWYLVSFNYHNFWCRYRRVITHLRNYNLYRWHQLRLPWQCGISCNQTARRRCRKHTP